MLHEIYYGEKILDRIVERIKERIQLCSDNLFKNESLSEILHSEHTEIKEIEVLRDFKINNQKVYVKLDALFINRNKKWIIVDWKTGLEYEKNEEQLLLYAIFLHDYYQVAYDDMEIRLEYLLTGECVKIEIDILKIIQVRNEIIESMDEMKSYLENEEENKPLPKLFFTATPTAHKCRGCKFKEICDESY
jgi:CRISPR/Cas system-associated exonuclease Cas4 (RecB family)